MPFSGRLRRLTKFDSLKNCPTIHWSKRGIQPGLVVQGFRPRDSIRPFGLKIGESRNVKIGVSLRSPSTICYYDGA
jgi:hypothetical protein